MLGTGFRNFMVHEKVLRYGGISGASHSPRHLSFLKQGPSTLRHLRIHCTSPCKSYLPWKFESLWMFQCSSWGMDKSQAAISLLIIAGKISRSVQDIHIWINAMDSSQPKDLKFQCVFHHLSYLTMYGAITFAIILIP
ncbi:hypothetical protein DVH24_019480 [Malus domestica]|uniref:Uncharacterized protein n=1 Tax=Malus domestica TaxID=3750 RepID=A0A498I2W2_MALDO|nr:hypothetical protein DVH24_019480 [Malus domestica]